MAVIDRVQDIVSPLVESMGLDLYDIEQAGPILRISVDSNTETKAIDGDLLTELTRMVSSAMDEHDPISGSYTLEVTSPGLERKLRTPGHFQGAIGEQIKLKLEPGHEVRRAEGTLVSAEEDSITVETDGIETVYHLDHITTARTVFVWEKAEKTGSKKRSAK